MFLLIFKLEHNSRLIQAPIVGVFVTYGLSMVCVLPTLNTCILQLPSSGDRCSRLSYDAQPPWITFSTL